MSEKPWLQSYDKDVPAQIDIPEDSLSDLFVKNMNAFQDQPAYFFMGVPFLFGDLLERSGRFASALQRQGVVPGDAVAINLPNIPQYLIAIAGALRAGCVVSGLAPLLTPEEMAFQLNDSAARVLITLDLLYEPKVMPIADKTPGAEIIVVTGAGETMPGVSPPAEPAPLEGKKVFSFSAFMAGGDAQPEPVLRRPDQDCYMQYTGGTTGPPKGAVLTHGNMVSNIYQFSTWFGFQNGKECWLSAFPMFHSAGLFVASCGMATAQTQVLIPDPRNLKSITDGIANHRPSIIGNVPSLTLMLMADETFRNLDFSPVRYWLSGAAPFPAETISSLEEIVGQGKLGELWGMTETCPMVTINPALGTKKPGSVGLPLPNTDLRIVDLKDGKAEVPLGQEGEILVCGPQVTRGYLNKPEETQQAIREYDGRRWLHTGDVGRMDEQGYVYVVDRAKDMIIVGGYKVFSSEVEGKFHKHPAIGACALVGLPNPDRPDSEVVKLVVQKAEAYEDKPNEEMANELIDFARSHMAPYKVPKVIEFVDALPMTSVGKIDKKALRK